MMAFCQVVELPGAPRRYAVVAPSPFGLVEGAALAVFDGQYEAEIYAKRVNKLYRVRHEGRAAAAKDKA